MPNPEKPIVPKEGVLLLSTVLKEEFKAIHEREINIDIPSVDIDENAPAESECKRLENIENKKLEIIFEEIHKQKQSALCLSGGGIRSATFCLGVLQGLAQKKLLEKFDYLSTVSGGGYIGGWLTAWSKREGEKEVFRKLKDDLYGSKSKLKTAPEPEQIGHLRSYSNLLTPKIGLLSVDTWTLVAIYFRNLFLNWLVLVPLMLAILLIPRGYTALAKINIGEIPFISLNLTEYFVKNSQSLGYGALIIGLFFGAVALAYINSHRPSLKKPEALSFGQTVQAEQAVDNSKTNPIHRIFYALFGYFSDRTNNFKLFFIIPLILSAACLTIGRAWYVKGLPNIPFSDFESAGFWDWYHYAAGGLALMVLGWLFSFIGVLCFSRTAFKDYLWNPKRIFELATVSVSGFLGGICLWLLSLPGKLATLSNCKPPPSELSETLFVCPNPHSELFTSSALMTWLDVPQLMIIFLLMGIFSNGLGSRWSNDDDREWWARAAAFILLFTVIWAVVNALVITIPNNLKIGEYSLSTPFTLIGSIAGFVTILFAVSSKTPANDRQAEKAGRLTNILDYGIKAAAPVFTGFLIVFLSFLTDFIIVLIKYLPGYKTPVAQWLPPFVNWSNPPNIDYRKLVENIHTETSFIFLACLFLSLLGIALFMACVININQFSLHSLYRNRLIRTYLGASNDRKPDSFTDFDQNDDVCMSELKYDGKFIKPFHVVNMTWNLVKGKRLAWQNRMATTFTVSSLHAGNFQTGYRKSSEYGGEYELLGDQVTPAVGETLQTVQTANSRTDDLQSKEEAFQASSKQSRSKPITLGTALTISGAAASPNMGYYSSTFVTFLMTVFNARLGWWLGNPRDDKSYKRSGPRLALMPMINELLGRTEEDKEYIYLSDGGHFENLGLYEMVLRRCHYIFVVDASRDPDQKFENLGNAIRRIRVDLGIDITIENYPKKKDLPSPYCAIGTIHYDNIDNPAPYQEKKAANETDTLATGDNSNKKDSKNGILIYIKPSLIGEEPTDIFNYAQDNAKFPHDPTSDLWFSEQQFESYRTLGQYAISQIFEKPLEGEGFTNLKEVVSDYLNKPKESDSRTIIEDLTSLNELFYRNKNTNKN